MEDYQQADIRFHIAQLTDPRIERNKRHSLVDIIMVVLAGMMCRNEGWEEIEEWAKLNKARLATFLALPNGIPSHDTLRRVFQMIDPKALQARIIDWINVFRVKVKGEVIAIDGKTVRGAGQDETGKHALHSVSAFASEARMVLAQLKTDEKSNEITAIPELLDLIDVSDCTVTIDAMGCQTAIAEKIVKRKADYVLALKGNQPNLLENVSGFFETEQGRNFRDVRHQYRKTVAKGHGRLEIREYWHSDDIAWLSERSAWKGLSSVGMVKRTRTIAPGTSKEKTSTELHYYISTLPMNVNRFEHAVRSHWAIENSLHWVLDVTLNEDGSRIKKDRAPENLAVMRRTVLNLLRREVSLLGKSAPKKMLWAAYNP